MFKQILSLLVILASMVVGGCRGNNDRLPSEVNGDERRVESSNERNAVYAAEEAEAAEARRNEAEREDGVATGLSQRVYENLEQPAELVGRNEMLLFKSQFIISYNSERWCPNYVCWSLTRERVGGKVKRSDNFHADPVLVASMQVESSDFNGSGYDRGHMCPAGDNKNSETAMDESFCMTNVCAQNRNLNAGAWNDLEQQCRQWARDYGTLYICCGPLLNSDKPHVIGSRKGFKVAVPDAFFKVVLMMGREPKAIGFVYPNEPCKGDMRDYAVSVDHVEELAGMDFFFQLDDEEEARLEKACNPAAWGI